MASLSALRLAGLLALLCLQALGLVLHEQLPGVPAGWTVAGTPNDDTQIVLQIALSQRNLDKLETELAAVSNPHSPSYGKYLDHKQVIEMFSASKASSAAVESWLKSSGITQYSKQGDSVWFKSTVSKANAMLDTTFHNYVDFTGTTKLRTTHYSLPQRLTDHVDLISPTTYFGRTKAQRAIPAPETATIDARQASGICNMSIQYANKTYAVFGPACLKAQYNINGYVPDPAAGSKIGFGSFLNQSASFSDLALFEQHFGIPTQNFSVVLVNPQQGATDLPQPPLLANDGEANLDSQYIVGIAHPLPVTEFITAGSPPYFPDPVEPAGTPNENEPYLRYYEYLTSQPNSALPNVISNSYGDEEQTVPENFAIRVCNLIGMLGLRGISVLHSSGDEGVGASCLSTDGKQAQFNPIFPATCPYLTSVGGTVNFDPEIAWDGSSGGFSYYFKQPWYQSNAVGTFLSEHISGETKEYYGPYVDFSGRGFPDVAAHSVHPDYTVFQGGDITPSGGTSAAVPVTASIVALLNDARFRAGKPALGFLNPLIYSAAYKGFTDITYGQSDGCTGNNTQTDQPVPGAGVIPGAHWNATPGWDPVTGFGVPNFGDLLQLAMQY